ncbi:MAG TPA: hypothetical protein VMJ31_09480 [Methylocystis sp.]|nr:hypothetical protein [Methylocystis sp.]
MPIKFLREIAVSSLATALVTAVYMHGPEAINALSAASLATPASLDGEGQRPEDLAQFTARVASGHVGKFSPRSPIAEALAAAAASSDSDPVWPPQSSGARPAHAATAAKPATASASSPPVRASAPATSPLSSPAPPEASPAQAESAPASYTSRIVDKFKDSVWNPGASVVHPWRSSRCASRSTRLSSTGSRPISAPWRLRVSWRWKRGGGGPLRAVSCLNESRGGFSNRGNL